MIIWLFYPQCCWVNRCRYCCCFKIFLPIMTARTLYVVLSSWHSCCESSPGALDECSTVPTGHPHSILLFEFVWGGPSQTTGATDLPKLTATYSTSFTITSHFTIPWRIEGWVNLVDCPCVAWTLYRCIVNRCFKAFYYPHLIYYSLKHWSTLSQVPLLAYYLAHCCSIARDRL